MIDDKTLEEMLDQPTETKERYIARMMKMYPSLGPKFEAELRETATDDWLTADGELMVDREIRAEFLRLWCVPSSGDYRPSTAAFRLHLKWCREQAVKNVEAKRKPRPIE